MRLSGTTSNTDGCDQDPAFLDRVDIKQFVPSPSQSAIYNIFRSCLNALVADAAPDGTAHPVSPKEADTPAETPQQRTQTSPEDGSTTKPEKPSIATLEQMKIEYYEQPDAACRRLWTIARKCEGFSGRRLRRLPIHGLAMYTWCSRYSLDDAVTALEAAVDEDLQVKSSGTA